MNKNMGAVDRTIRIIIAIAFIVLAATRTVTGPWAIVLWVVAIVFALTSIAGFCPAYSPLKWSTRKKKTTPTA